MSALSRIGQIIAEKALRPAKRQVTVLASGLVAIGIVVAGGVAVGQYLYDRHVQEASDGLRNLSYVVSDHANRSMQAVDRSVAAVVERLQARKPRTVQDMGSLADAPEIQALLKQAVAENPFLENVLVIGADGKLDRRSRSGSVPPWLTAGSQYMTELEASRPGAFTLSNPFQNESLHSWMMNFSQRVSAPDGTFLGAVAGIVKLSQFSDLFDKISLGAHGSISMFRDDGTLVSWAPQSEVPFGTAIGQTGVFRDFIASRRAGATSETGVDDNINRLVAVAYTADFPLATVVAMGVPDVVAGWRGQVRILVGGVSLAVLLIALGTLTLAYRIDKVAQDRERQMLERQMAEQARILSNAINNLTHGVAMFDAANRLMVWNSRYAEMFGLPDDVLRVGVTRAALLDYRGLHGFGRTSDRPMQQPDGSALTHSTMEDGRVIAQRKKTLAEGGWVSTHEDVTAQRAAERKIHDIATRDSLTGLLNRAAFKDFLHRAVAEASRGGAKYAIFYVDLDRFKQVNDTLGHPAGDELLKQVSERILAATRKGDTVCRLGGDEFAIIQRAEVLPRDAMKLADRLIQRVSAPYEIAENRVVIGASVGIAVAPTDTLEADELIRNADLALYHSKQNGRGVYTFFASSMDEYVQRRRALEDDLRAAIAGGHFTLYYQPVVSMRDRSVLSFEALIRWRHPTRGFVSPVDFIPLAEETGLIVKIGEWVLKEACRHAARLPSRIRIAVNVSPAQFRSADFLDSVETAVRDAGVSASRLIVEITEGVLVKDVEQAAATVDALRARGVLVAMDDFGTGYSSMSYIQRLHFNKLKIDRSFVSKLGQDDSAEPIIRATIAMAGALNLTPVAEGIETEEQCEILAAAGCVEGQGYLFSRPMPADDTFDFLGVKPIGEPEAAPVIAFTPSSSPRVDGDRGPRRPTVHHVNSGVVRQLKASQ